MPTFSRPRRTTRLVLFCFLTWAVRTAAADGDKLQFTVSANAKPGAVLGSVCGEPDNCKGATFRIVSGNPDYVFHIDPYSGTVILLRSPDEQKAASVHTLVVEERRQVQLKDKPLSDDFAAHAHKLGGDAANLQRTTIRQLTVEIEIQPVVRPFRLEDWVPSGPLVLSVPENSRAGTVVAKLDLSTGSFVRHLQYELLSQPAPGMFEVSSDGRVTLRDPAELNFETRGEFALRIQVSDRQGESAVLDAHVQVRDVNEPPTLNFEPLALDWPPAEKTAIGRVLCSDPDAGDELSLQMECADPRPHFDAVTGTLFWNVPADEPAPPGPIKVQLRATDAGGLSAAQNVWITFRTSPAPEPNRAEPVQTEQSAPVAPGTTANGTSNPMAPSGSPVDSAQQRPQASHARTAPPPAALPEVQPTIRNHLNGDRIALMLSLTALAMAILRIRALRLQLNQERRWAEIARSAVDKPPASGEDWGGEAEGNASPPGSAPFAYASDDQLKLDLADLFAASDLGEALDLNQLRGATGDADDGASEQSPAAAEAGPVELLVAVAKDPTPAPVQPVECEESARFAKTKSRDLDDVQLSAFRTIANSSARNALKTHGLRQRRPLRVVVSGVLIGLALFFPANNLLPTDPVVRLVAVIAVILTVMLGLHLLLKYSLEGKRNDEAGSV